MKHFLLIPLLILSGLTSVAQVGINTNGNPPDASAILDVQSTSGGFLFPRMTTSERDNIGTPALGLTIFNLDTGCVQFYVGGVWQNMACGCLAAPGTPSAGTVTPTHNQVSWSWTAVSGASGYKYNTTNSFGTATDVGTSLSFTQTGLTCGGTNYTLYVWAYNDCGNSAPLTLSATTDACPFVCGSSTVSHAYVSGVSPANSAPYTNTYSYPTVSGDTYPALGPGKCWTGLNLGAIGDPTAWNDNQAVHAGWHFQFNRKQAYYQSGSGVTPSWTIQSISENNNWIASNDPCYLLFGSTWHVPTESEWSSYRSGAVAQGGINNGNLSAAFSSPMKLHAGGGLEDWNGAFNNIGNNAYYWTSIQQNTSDLGKMFYLNSSSSSFTGNYKSFGKSLRCVK